MKLEKEKVKNIKEIELSIEDIQTRDKEITFSIFQTRIKRLN